MSYASLPGLSALLTNVGQSENISLYQTAAQLRVARRSAAVRAENAWMQQHPDAGDLQAASWRLSYALRAVVDLASWLETGDNEYRKLAMLAVRRAERI